MMKRGKTYEAADSDGLVGVLGGRKKFGQSNLGGRGAGDGWLGGGGVGGERNSQGRAEEEEQGQETHDWLY